MYMTMSYVVTIYMNYFQIQILSKRCDFNMNQCEHFHNFVIHDICKIFDQTNQIWSDFIAHTKPRAKCPFKAVPVKVMNATVDFSYIANLPLGGYAYILTFKVFKSIPNVRYKKEMFFCFLVESNVVNSRKSTRELAKTYKTQ